MQISLISKYRSQLMAVAMIWVAFYHSNFPFLVNKGVSFILCKSGYAGADMFVFLSGFGIYFACKKNEKFVDYLKRRVKRILPYSVAIFLLLFFIGRVTLDDALINGLGLSMWLRTDLSCWYISFILFMYILTPLYLKLFNKEPYKISLFSIIIVFVLCQFLNAVKYYIFVRTNIYIVGILLGYIFDKNPNQNVWWLVLISIFGWILLYYLYHYQSNETIYISPFLLVVPGMSLLCAYIFDKIKLLQKPFEFLSKYTLVFYLLHEQIIQIIYSYYSLLYIPGIYFDYLINILAFIITLLVSIIIKAIIDYLINKIERIKK